MLRDEVGRRWRVVVGWLGQSTGEPPRLTPWAWAADAVLALVLTIGALSGATLDADAPAIIDPRVRPVVPDGVPMPPPVIFGAEALDGRDLFLIALTALPLVARRRFPLTSFWIIAIAATRVFGFAEANLTWSVIAFVVAAYSAPTHSRYRNLALVSVVVAALVVILSNEGDLPALPSGLMTFLLLSTVGLAANVIHTWRQRAQTLRREQAAATQLAIEHERARLARELHDVVGHNVSVMVVQAGAARKVLQTDPDAAREALLAVEAGGRAAMTELRQVIGLLTVDSDTDLAPQPGLDQLPALADRVRESGVPVTLDVSGTFESLPTGVELAAYRVVQEALTNAVRHAPGAAVAITVTGTPEELRVEVIDTGAGAAPDAGHGRDPSSGRGLTGLRERLAAYGGTLVAGRRPTGGFRVLAVTPLRDSR